MATGKQPVEEVVRVRADFIASITADGKTYTTRQFVKSDTEAIVALIEAETKRDRNLFPLTKEMLSGWMSKGHGVVTEVTDTKGTRIIAFMGAHEFPEQFMTELRAAVVDPAYRKLKYTDPKTGIVMDLNINERNRRMLLRILFTVNPNMLVRSVRNGAVGADGVEDYYESMRSMGFKRVFEFHGDACLRFEERVAAALGVLLGDEKDAASRALEARLEQARIEEAGRSTATALEMEKVRAKMKELSGYSKEVQEERADLQRKLDRLERAMVPHAKVTLLIKPWFDSTKDTLLRN